MVCSRGTALTERCRVDGVSVGRQRELVSDAVVDGAFLCRQPLVQIRAETYASAWTPFDGLRSAFRAADAAASPSLESSRALDSRVARRRVRSGSDTAFALLPPPPLSRGDGLLLFRVERSGRARLRWTRRGTDGLHLSRRGPLSA